MVFIVGANEFYVELSLLRSIGLPLSMRVFSILLVLAEFPFVEFGVLADDTLF